MHELPRQGTEMTPEKLRKRRAAAVRRILDKDNLPRDMRRYWTNVLVAIAGWELEKRYIRRNSE